MVDNCGTIEAQLRYFQVGLLFLDIDAQILRFAERLAVWVVSPVFPVFQMLAAYAQLVARAEKHFQRGDHIPPVGVVRDFLEVIFRQFFIHFSSAPLFRHCFRDAFKGL